MSIVPNSFNDPFEEALACLDRLAEIDREEAEMNRMFFEDMREIVGIDPAVVEVG